MLKTTPRVQNKIFFAIHRTELQNQNACQIDTTATAKWINSTSPSKPLPYDNTQFYIYNLHTRRKTQIITKRLQFCDIYPLGLAQALRIKPQEQEKQASAKQKQ